jgi:hypothetical protein
MSATDGIEPKDIATSKITQLKEDLKTFSEILQGINVQVKAVDKDKGISAQDTKIAELTRLGKKISDDAYELNSAIIALDFEAKKQNRELEVKMENIRAVLRQFEHQIKGFEIENNVHEGHPSIVLKTSSGFVFTQKRTVLSLSVPKAGEKPQVFLWIDGDPKWDYIKKSVTEEIQRQFRVDPIITIGQYSN